MSDGNTLVWNEPPHLDGDLLDRLHSVVHEEYLAAAIDLQPDGVLDRLIVPGHDVGDDRLTIAGWRANQREIAQPAEGEVQGARDGGRRHREHVDAALQGLEPLLLHDAELLLLVDHQQPEIFEPHVR